MKRILITTIAALTLFAFSCKKDNQPHDLFIGATLKNTGWLAQPSTSYFANQDSLQINGTNTTSNQGVEMHIRFTGIGNYTLRNNQASFSVTLGPIGGDGPSYRYNLDTTQTNTLRISSFDVKTNIAKGNFQVHFVRPSLSNAPDGTLSLTNGSFWIQTPAVPGQ